MEKNRNIGIEKYINYVRVMLKEVYQFNEDEINDAIQNIELARLEALARGADVDKTYSILRKSTLSFVNKRLKEKTEISNYSEAIERYDDKDNESSKDSDMFIFAFDGLSKKEQGIILGRFLKGQMSEIDILEYTDVIYKLTEKIAQTDPEIASAIYDRLCTMQDERKLVK